MSTSLRIAGLLAAAFLVTGCGGSDDVASTPTPSATTATTTPTSPATSGPTLPATPSDGGTPTCTTKGLAVTVTPSKDGNAAGSAYNDLVFTNKGSATCAIYGWPGVSYVGDGNGTQVGAPADRTGTPKIVRLKPGQSGTALLREIDAENFDDSCTLALVDGLRIYPPNQKDAVFVAHKTHGCAAIATHTLVIAPVTN